jgi:hypothetical protein
MTTTNLPSREIQDSAARTKLFFDSYGKEPLEFNANDVDATVGFFTKKGFDEQPALVAATTLLKQAKLENIPVFQILDTIGEFDQLELSGLVGEILNNNRPATSTLGYREPLVTVSKQRNVVP